jgi:alpha-N-arabinofuranosidase
MADAVFTASFLNMANRNCDIIGMTNFAPMVNTRGIIFTHEKGIVLRPPYHVFDMYVNSLGETVLDTLLQDNPVLKIRDKEGNPAETSALDVLTTLDEKGNIVIAAVNKDPVQKHSIKLEILDGKTLSRYSMQTLAGKSPDSYNDIDKTEAVPSNFSDFAYKTGEDIFLPPHSVNILKFS